MHLVIGFGDMFVGTKKDSNKTNSKNAIHVLCTSYFLYMYSTYASYGFSGNETNVVDVPKKH